MNDQDVNSAVPKQIAAVPRTRKQISASLLADGLALKARWKTLIADAKSVWPKISAEELASAHGDIHRLAGMVQLRCQLSREESDRQVKAFFAKHAAKA